MTFSVKQTHFLPIPDYDFTLNPQKIDIWQYPLDALWPEATLYLNAAESDCAQRYHFERHRRRFTIARAMLRIILARYLNLSPQDLAFATNSYGKPYLIHPTRIQFNLSHSHDLALLAIGQDTPLGVDIEFFSSRPFAGMSKIMFSPQEIQEYTQVPTSMRSLSFFHIWAQKEAFIKACGMGLSYPTQTFDVPVFPPTNLKIKDTRHHMTWHMQSFMPKIACCAALCHDPAIQIVRYRTLTKAHHVFA